MCYVFKIILLHLNLCGVFSFDYAGDSWLSIPMPMVSNFIGYDPPTDERRWKESQLRAKSGELVLLNKIFEQIKRGQDIYSPDIHYKWVHK